eukprot:jgi/Chrzof1/6079/Cz17g08050.t1
MKVTKFVLLALLATAAVAAARPMSRALLQTTLDNVETIGAPTSADVSGSTWGPIVPTFTGRTNVTATNANLTLGDTTDGNRIYVPLSITASANESDPKGPVKANATITVELGPEDSAFPIATIFPFPPSGPLLAAQVQATANSITGPARANVDLEGSNTAQGSIDLRGQATARAFPGSLTSLELATTNVKATTNSNSLEDYAQVVARADGQAAKGQTAAFVNANATSTGNAAALAFVRSRARSFDGYMTGGIATAGSRTSAIGGTTRGTDDLYSAPGDYPAAAVRSDTQARANMGAANAGALINARAKGNVITRGTVTSRTYAGESATGLINIGIAGQNAIAASPGVPARAATGGNARVTSVGDGVAATTGVGAAASGAVMVAIAPGSSGDARIGDYDSEADTTDNEVIARARGRGVATGGLVNLAYARNGAASIVGDTITSSQQGAAGGAAIGLANAFYDASNTLTSTTSTTEAPALNLVVGLSQGTGRVTNTLSGSAKTNVGAVGSAALANSVVGQDTSAVGSSTATTGAGPAASAALSQAFGGVTSASQGSSTSTTKTGNSLSIGSALSGSTLTARAVGTSKAESEEGASVSLGVVGALAADSQSNSASAATTVNGNALSASNSVAAGLLQGESASASAASSDIGGAGVTSLSLSSGAINSRSVASGTAQTNDGNAQSAVTSAAIGVGLASSNAKSTAATKSGNAAATADSYGLSLTHGIAVSNAKSSTGSKSKNSTANANSVAVGFIGEASAKASANSPENPGKAVASAICVGVICKVDNGGSAKVAVGPAQALTGGFAVSAPQKVVVDVNNAAAAAAAIQKAVGTTPAPPPAAAANNPLAMFVAGLAQAAARAAGH